ncbi:MAG TPA: hypothetical protein VH575_26035 [Gemmataceae bacterium]
MGQVTKRLKRFIKDSVQRMIGITEVQERLENLQKGLSDPTSWSRILNDVACANQAVQQQLSRSYRTSLHPQVPLPSLLDAEFRCFSQNGEDGILLYLFSLIGTTNKRVVEICAGNGIECNAANLIVNQGWIGLLVDGSAEKLAVGKQFYANCRDTFFYRPTLLASWITAENVNALVADNGFAGEIDLLSLDLDGMDYWVLKALTCIRPRAIILEVNTRWGPERAVTLPYRPDFTMDWNRHPWCGGASLPAFVNLGRERGYRLVGTNRQGMNALFLRADVGADVFPEISALEAYRRCPYLRHWSPDSLPSPADRPEWWDVVEV